MSSTDADFSGRRRLIDEDAAEALDAFGDGAKDLGHAAAPDALDQAVAPVALDTRQRDPALAFGAVGGDRSPSFSVSAARPRPRLPGHIDGFRLCTPHAADVRRGDSDSSLGIENRNVAPCPGADDTVSVPPISWQAQ